MVLLSDSRLVPSFPGFSHVEEDRIDVTEQGHSDMAKKTPGPSTKGTAVTPSTTPDACSTSGDQFTANQQMIKIQQRFEEGYNILIEPEYVQWLEIHHPEALPAGRYDLATVQ